MIQDSFSLKGKNIQQALTLAEAVVKDCLEDRAARGEDFSRNFDAYNGNHAKYFRKRLDESDELFKYRKDNAVINNLCAFTVDLSSKYLYGKASKVVRQFSKNEDTNKKLLSLIYDKIEIESFLLEASRQTSIYGEQIVRLIPVDGDTKEPLSGRSNKNAYPHPILLDPRFTFAKVNTYGKIQAVVMFYVTRDYATNKVLTVMELVTNDKRVVWTTEGNVSLSFGKATTMGVVGVPFFSGGYNSAGREEDNVIPLSNEFVRFVNADNLASDLSKIIDLNITLDEALTDKKHYFARHGWPQLVTSVDLRNVEKSPNKIWQVPKEFGDDDKVQDKFGFLTWEGKQDHQQIYVEDLERRIMILSNTAAISTGDLKAIGQLRSGAALITAHSIAIHKTEAKQIVWHRNEAALYRAIVNYDSYLHETTPDLRYPEYKLYLKFPKDFVPGAEVDRVNIQNIQLAGHLKPLEDILLEEYGPLTAEEVKAKRDMIIKDSEEIIDSARLFESKKVEENKPALRSPTVKSSEQTKQT